MDELERLSERGKQLLKLNRPKEAIAELQKVLAVEPNDEEALSNILLCYLDLKDFENADIYANKLLTVTPDEAPPYYYKAYIEYRKSRYAQAEEYIRDAIRLNPYEAAFFGLLSGILIQQAEWEKALEYANQGLAIDPENTTCLNHRTRCLTQLDRYEDIDDSVEKALQSDPYDAYTHANAGWTKLQLNDHEQAKIHFAEALQIDPQSEYAREGMKEAIKAKNPLYRLFLRYQFFMSKYSNLGQIAIIVVIFFGGRYLDNLSENYPILLPVYYGLVLLIYLTWVMKPFGDLFLRLDSFGKLVLSEDEKRCSEIVGVGMLVGILAGIAYLFTEYTQWWMLCFVGFSIAIPLYHMITFRFIEQRRYLGLLLIALAIIFASISLYQIFIEQEVSLFWNYYTYSVVAYLWLINLGVISRKS